MGSTRSNPKRKQSTTSFAGIPRIVMEHSDYKNLSGSAVKLLNLMAYQYRGKNNGNLTAAWGFANKHGFKSQATLSRAANELLDSDLLVRTRTGRFLNPGGRCALYALTWQAVDDCNGITMEVMPTSTPPRKFSIERNENKTPATESV